MRRKIPCWKFSEDGVTRTSLSCRLPDDLLHDVAVKWPSAEIEIAHSGAYSLMPGYGQTGIPLGMELPEVEDKLRRLLKA